MANKPLQMPGKDMTLRLNFKLGEPTANGRVYTEEAMRSALANFGPGKKTLFLHDGFPQGDAIQLHKIVGVVKDFSVLKTKEVSLDCSVLNSAVADGLRSGASMATSCGVGKLAKDDKTVEDFRLLCISVVPKEEV